MENCLLKDDDNLKVCDFGWAAKLSNIEYSKERAGTLPYMSPESLMAKP